MGLLRREKSSPKGEAAAHARRSENVAFANSLLETEISQRNARKDAQENTARGLIVTAGVVLTLLLGLANDAGLFLAKTSIVAKIALVATVFLGALAAASAMAVLWPRRYDRLGKKGLDKFNQNDFLDQPSHQLTGAVVATRIAIAKTMDHHHERKARWLKWAFRLLAGAFIGLVVQAIVLAVDPPPSKPSAQVRILLQGRNTP
jgi:hypothetical protein